MKGCPKCDKWFEGCARETKRERLVAPAVRSGEAKYTLKSTTSNRRYLIMAVLMLPLIGLVLWGMRFKREEVDEGRVPPIKEGKDSDATKTSSRKRSQKPMSYPKKKEWAVFPAI